MTLAAVSTALSISITLLVIILVVVSLLMILVVMMQRPKQEGLGAAFGGGMTDQLLGAGTTSFLQKATVILGILFFMLSLILGILVGRSNKQKGIDVQTPVATEQKAAPSIADGIQVIEDGDEDALLEAIETAVKTPEVESTPVEVESAVNESAEEVLPEVIVPEEEPSDAAESQ